MFIASIYLKKSVYIHSINIINVPIGETVSVEATIKRKTGFRRAENQG